MIVKKTDKLYKKYMREVREAKINGIINVISFQQYKKNLNK